MSCGCDSSLSSKQLARYLKESSRGASGSSGPMAGEENPGANRNAIVKLKGQILNETRMPSGRGTKYVNYNSLHLVNDLKYFTLY